MGSWYLKNCILFKGRPHQILLDLRLQCFLILFVRQWLFVSSVSAQVSLLSWWLSNPALGAHTRAANQTDCGWGEEILNLCTGVGCSWCGGPVCTIRGGRSEQSHRERCRRRTWRFLWSATLTITATGRDPEGKMCSRISRRSRR